MDSSGPVGTEEKEVQLNFPESVVNAIEELLPNAEQFDNPDFNTVQYINGLFPTEQSLSNIEAVAARCEYRASCVDDEIQQLVRGAAERREVGHRALHDARHLINQLALQVLEINKKAERSEVMVREITAEIKQLDAAKTNLTTAITALNHYHMLVGGATTLAHLTKDRLYRDLLLPLQACTEVLQHFESYHDIRQISELRDDVTRIRTTLSQQILADFKEAFTAGSKSTVSQRTLADACLVVDVLDDKVKLDLIKWVVNMELQEYVHLFSAEQEAAWVSRVERRYAWLKRHLLAFQQSRAALYPPAWDLPRAVARRFCEITREELSKLMAARRDEIDVKLLLYAIQKTYNFELLLHKRFVDSDSVEAAAIDDSAQNTYDPDGKDALPTSEAEVGQCKESPWVGSIGGCFEPYLSLYINSLDTNLRQLMDRFIQDAKLAAGAGAAAGAEAAAGAGAVLSSCAELFLFYKKCLVQCAQLSTGEPMTELCAVFGKYLREYAALVLQASLPRAGGAGGGAGGGGGLAALRDLPAAVPSLVNNLHTFLRDDAASLNVRFTNHEVSRITSVITTSEYCLETTVHLQQKLKEKVSPHLAERVDLVPEQDLFHKIISNCIQLLVQDLELACEPALASMTKISWLAFDSVGDQSSYVTQIVMHLKNTVPGLRDHLASSRKYFTQFCIRFANSFIPKFIQHLYRCKPMSTVGSEQLLLDTHMLKTCLLELPALGSAVRRPAPATYTKVVVRLMTKAEMILKLVMAPLEGGGGAGLEGFVRQLLQLLPECSLAEFHKVLDMKGLRLGKAQLAAADALFRDAARGAGAGLHAA